MQPLNFRYIISTELSNISRSDMQQLIMGLCINTLFKTTVLVTLTFVSWFCHFSNIWHWAYIFLTIVLNILVLVAWKDPADVTPETER